MDPDICSSFNCSPPNIHCLDCSHAIYIGTAKVGKRNYRWEFSPRFGPLFYWGKDSQGHWSGPNDENHPLWKAFEKWYYKKFIKGKKCSKH